MAMPRSKVVIVHVTGPLAPYVTEVESSLKDCGYTPLTRVRHLQVMVHLSRWLQARQLGVGELTGRRVEQYLAERRAAGYTAFCSRRSVAPLLGSLGSLGLLPGEGPAEPACQLDVLLAGFSGTCVRSVGWRPAPRRRTWRGRADSCPAAMAICVRCALPT